MSEHRKSGAAAPGLSAQARCDAIQSDFRAGRLPAEPVPEKKPLRRANVPPLDAALIPCEDQLRLRLAEELEYARRMLESLGDSLTTDISVVVRHAVSLQSIDIIGQLLGHIAAVTRSSAPERAVDRIGMSDLKARLNRKSSL